MTDLAAVRTDPMSPIAEDVLPRSESPIVPKRSISGRALVAVVAIMTFLASLTTGAVVLVRQAALDWQSDVSREVTIQVRPSQSRDIEAEVDRAMAIARTARGVVDVRAYTKAESGKLLEPWLGSGLALDDLPVPRMIVLKLASGPVDLAPLKQALAERVNGASLDDHRAWVDRMRSMAQTAILCGFGLLGLMLAATVLSVTFATRGAMAANRPIVEVLHFIGAKGGFIASQFQRHFLLLGLEGGIIGGGAAMALFALAAVFGDTPVSAPGAGQLVSLFGNLKLGWLGYAAILGQIVLIAVVTALASRRTVNQTLEAVR
jgi:cell division transport system permease protein